MAAEFLDRIQLVSQAVLARIQGAHHVPTTLAHASMEAELAVANMLDRLSRATDDAMAPALPDMPGVVAIRIEGRKVAASEAPRAITQVLAAADRYRQLGMLSMEMIRTLARLGHDRLALAPAGERETIDIVERIVADAILTKDVDRANYGEPVQLLPLLVGIFDRWLAASPQAPRLWQGLRDAYGATKDDRFDTLVGNIRALPAG